MPATDNQLKAVVQKITDLPTLPALFVTLTRLIQDPHTSAEQLGRALSTDMTLVSKVLKLVNSAFYGFPGRIGTVSQAIVILGFSSIRNIVLTTSVMKMWEHPKLQKQFDLDGFWRHSLQTAALSKALAMERAIPFMEELFIAGLLHDIGRIVLSGKLPEDFEKVLDYRARRHVSLLEAEKKVLGLTHAELGAFLAKKWNLPAPLVEIIRCHHAPELADTSPGAPLSGDASASLAVVRLADALSRVVTEGELPPGYVEKVAPGLWEQVGFESLPGGGFPDRAREEIGKALAFLSV